jgi:hydrogenase nickel incorporation protein HypA/HybF
MHELSVCLSLVQQVVDIAQKNNAVAVDRVLIKIGPLSGIEPQLLRNAYPLAAVGTLAGDAELVIAAAEVEVRCNQCGAESRVAANRLLCPACGDFRTTLLSGDELLLQSVEMRTSERANGAALASASEG